MEGRHVIDVVRKAVADAQAAGHKAIDPVALISFLDSLDEEDEQPSVPHEVLFEEHKARLAKWLSDNEHANAWSLESFRQVIALGQSAIQSIFLINGGASVAVLAFIGHLASAPTTAKAVLPFAGSLRFFVAGVFFAAVTSAATYLSQLAYEGSKTGQQVIGVVLHALAVALGVTSFVFFFVGAQAAYRAFASIAP